MAKRVLVLVSVLVLAPSVAVGRPGLDDPALMHAAISPGMEQLAAASLAFAEGSIDGRPPSEVLAALTPVLEAQSALARTWAPGARLHEHTTRELTEHRELLAAIEGGALTQDEPRDVVNALLAMQPRPEPRSPLPVLREFSSSEEAMLALLAWYDHAPTDDERATIAAYRALPADADAALARIIAAFLSVDEATRIAYPADGTPFDAGLLMDARDRVADVVLRDAPIVFASPPSLPVLDVCPTDPVGIVLIDLNDAANEYFCAFRLQIDRGGLDQYHNRAGGNLFPNEAAMLVEGDGPDFYGCTQADSGIGGGAFHGVGLLFDLGGDDATLGQITGSGSQDGGAVNGVGLVVDKAGIDSHFGIIGGSGASTGGGVDGGVGTLIDLESANDAYFAAIASFGALNGGGSQGTGYLLDAGGTDAYAGSINGPGAMNGAGAGAPGHPEARGAGHLLDLGGALDSYYGTVQGDGALNAAGYFGSGFGYDADGFDMYNGVLNGQGAMNGAGVLGTGTLVDAGDAGNYFIVAQSPDGATNGGAIGALTDDSDDPHPAGAIGILLTGGGNDQAASAGVTQGAGAAYGVGAYLDRGGSTVLDAAPGSIAQAAAVQGGVGIVVDGGGFAGPSQYIARAGNVGPARGAQGVAVLLRPSDLGTMSYTLDVGVDAYRATGGGVVLWRDAALAFFQGLTPTPTFACAGDTLATPVNEDEATVRICKPAPELTSVTIIDPATGEPLPTVSAVSGPRALGTGRDVHPTTSGGLISASTLDAAVGADVAKEYVTWEALTYDRTCDPACEVL